ncbi:MAG TPA: hypothetical protein ENI23_16210 [bacterium]|nr:hypothetical protein [bacterium]
MTDKYKTKIVRSNGEIEEQGLETASNNIFPLLLNLLDQIFRKGGNENGKEHREGKERICNSCICKVDGKDCPS